MTIISKEKIIELYEKCHCLHENDVKRMAHIHKVTGADFQSIITIFDEYQGENNATR